MPILPATDHDDSQERSRRQILYYSRIGPGQRTVTGASQRAKAFRHAVPQRIGSRSPIRFWLGQPLKFDWCSGGEGESDQDGRRGVAARAARRVSLNRRPTPLWEEGRQAPPTVREPP